MRVGAEVKENKEVKVKTVEKTLKLLEILAEYNSPLPLTRLGHIANLSLSTTHRLLNTLCRHGFVEREKATGHYKLGLKAFLIGNAALQNVDLRQTALTVMNKLSEQIRETVYLGILSNQDIIYSDSAKTPGPFQIGVQLGIPVPACQTSSGKILLSCLPFIELQSYLQDYLTKKLIFNTESFLNELKLIKENAYAATLIPLGNNIREISAPIFNHIGICVGAISIFSPAYSETLTDSDQILLDEIRSGATVISQAMGFLR